MLRPPATLAGTKKNDERSISGNRKTPLVRDGSGTTVAGEVITNVRHWRDYA